MEVLMEAMGWTARTTLPMVAELKSAEQSQALCDNKVDAIVFTVGHPSGSIKEATTSCAGIESSRSSGPVDRQARFQRTATTARPPFRAEMYRGNPKPSQDLSA